MRFNFCFGPPKKVDQRTLTSKVPHTIDLHSICILCFKGWRDLTKVHHCICPTRPDPTQPNDQETKSLTLTLIKSDPTQPNDQETKSLTLTLIKPDPTQPNDQETKSLTLTLIKPDPTQPNDQETKSLTLIKPDPTQPKDQ